MIPKYVVFTSFSHIKESNLPFGIQSSRDELYHDKHMYTIDTLAYAPLKQFNIKANEQLQILLERIGFKKVELQLINDYKGFNYVSR